MPALRSPPGWRTTPLGRRAVSITLAVAAHGVIFLLLWTLAPSPTPPDEEEPPLSTFTVLPSPQTAPRPAPRASVVRSPRSSAAAPPAAATPPVATVPVPTLPTEPPPSPNALDSFDLASLPRRSGGGAASGTGDSIAPYGPGEGPGGMRLFNAQWQREPTDAELGTYLPADVPRPAWAMIACRTVEDFRVENCRALGESPIGSGLARAMRLAAWQFRVLPPRLGGRKLVGAWVRIRIDFGDRPAE